MVINKMKSQNNKVAQYTALSAHPLSNINFLGLFFTSSFFTSNVVLKKDKIITRDYLLMTTRGAFKK